MLKMDKEHVARALEEMATLLELKNENPFKVRAYLNAAHTLLNLDEDFEKLIKENRLIDYEGIGDALSEKIKILATTGTHPVYNELKRSVPAGLLDLMTIPGLGSKKIKSLYDHLKIDSIESLKKACHDGKVSKIAGFGEKTEQNILLGISHLETYSKRHFWWTAMSVAKPLLYHLQNMKGVKKADIAGSLRRKLETVGDLDFVASATDPKPVMEWFTTHSAVELVITNGETKSSVRLKGGIQAELRIVAPKQFGFALLYSTGSKSHNIKLRQLANEQGLSLSEWGMVPETPEVTNPFSRQKSDVSEADIYKALGLVYIPPELREDAGEIEAAKKNKLPHLIEEKDLRGAFHVHTTASDGRASLESMIKAAEELGWEYIGISDHSKSSFQAKGLSDEKLLEQVQHIKKLNKSKQFKTHIFSGVECDILPDGSLDYSEDVLKELDFVIVSVHSVLSQSEATMTKRLIRAIENPYTTMIGHVSGRLLLSREPYELNYQKVIDACIANGKIMELNSQPKRLDMDWRHWHKAVDKGLMCCINPDAHDRDQLQFVQNGIYIARKGWLEKDQVFNTNPLSKIKKLLKRS